MGAPNVGAGASPWLVELVDTFLLYVLAPLPALALAAVRARSRRLGALAALGGWLALAHARLALAGYLSQSD